MHVKTPKLLADIIDAAEFIVETTHGENLPQYRMNRRLRQAVERNFEIIGEAVNRLIRIDPAVAQHISNTAEIIAFRNVLIHGYDLIDDEQVWRIIVDSLPNLLREARGISGI